MNAPRIVCRDLDGTAIWQTESPAMVEVHARFGAEISSAKVALHPRSALPDLELGQGLEVLWHDQVKFRGEVADLRTDSASFPLVIAALRRPERKFRGTVRGAYTDQSPTEILESILDVFAGGTLLYDPDPVFPRTLDRLDFPGIPLFYAVDLLAKLAGNWLWWIDWEDRLRFVPPSSTPENVWYHDPDRMVLHPWLRDEPIRNEFAFFGGVTGGAEFVRFFTDNDSRDRFGGVEEHLFARSISTEQVFLYLRDAVLEQVPKPANYRAVDRDGEDLSASFGERFELRGNPLPRLEEDQVYRIAGEEIRWTEEGTRVRYHLAEGFESASRYARYLDHDPQGENFVAAHLGPFKLDLSALDSEAHLDP